MRLSALICRDKGLRASDGPGAFSSQARIESDYLLFFSNCILGNG